MGGTRSIACNTVARSIRLWAKDRNIWLSITHIEGKLNVDPDKLSRIFDDTNEWKINSVIFKQVKKLFLNPKLIYLPRV